MVAFVYLLEEVPHSDAEDVPWTKVGMSRNPPEWRLGANLKRGNPRHLTLGAVYEFETEQDALKAEGLAHERFKQFAHQKEWFSVHWKEIAEWCESCVGWQQRPLVAPVIAANTDSN